VYLIEKGIYNNFLIDLIWNKSNRNRLIFINQPDVLARGKVMKNFLHEHRNKGDV
jgi:hypothetical protein